MRHEQQIINWNVIENIHDLPPVRKTVLLKVKPSYGYREEYISQGELSGIGISKALREKLPDNDIRKSVYCSEDEDGNNLVPWRWSCASGNLFGQDVYAWAEI